MIPQRANWVIQSWALYTPFACRTQSKTGRPVHCFQHENCTFPFFHLPMIFEYFWWFLILFGMFHRRSAEKGQGSSAKGLQAVCQNGAGRNGAQTMQTETLAMVGMFWVSLWIFWAALGPPLSQHDVPNQAPNPKDERTRRLHWHLPLMLARPWKQMRMRQSDAWGEGWSDICDIWYVDEMHLEKSFANFWLLWGLWDLNQSSSVHNVPNQAPSPKEKKTPLASSFAPVGAVVKADAHEAKRRVGRGMIRYMICWWDVFGEVFWQFLIILAALGVLGPQSILFSPQHPHSGIESKRQEDCVGIFFRSCWRGRQSRCSWGKTTRGERDDMLMRCVWRSLWQFLSFWVSINPLQSTLRPHSGTKSDRQRDSTGIFAGAGRHTRGTATRIAREEGRKADRIRLCVLDLFWSSFRLIVCHVFLIFHTCFVDGFSTWRNLENITTFQVLR